MLNLGQLAIRHEQDCNSRENERDGTKLNGNFFKSRSVHLTGTGLVKNPISVMPACHYRNSYKNVIAQRAREIAA
jgi:hypothetical protein